MVLSVCHFLLNPFSKRHLSGLKLCVVYRCYVSFEFIIEDKPMIKHQTAYMTLFTVSKPIVCC